MKWNIGRKGKAWGKNEAFDRFSMAPEKIELVDGKLFWDEEYRLTMLALLLENVGIDEAVKIGDPQLWAEAIENFSNSDNVFLSATTKQLPDI